ncbi:hypothetical protein [Sulfurovum sp.]|jgi:hypothetical protein|uniref:hypothetical protein n=1 Tax=Sulfurovum sp. TaxID=1969726 RepID=UPI002A368815|nr:hypothetical protein [Sulfurovum sp.]MDD2451775.1 hypothetical protein [Sulfurovum sp.]MDD3500257.1 hypothetical protein [Sulfurovum sp.]MDY0401956.1 hypothetical protein [Sulfurovum sp.]
MQEDMKIELKHSTVENLQLYSELLGKDVNRMLEEALELYFEAQQKRLREKNFENENMMTDLDYDEFWDGVDL